MSIKEKITTAREHMKHHDKEPEERHFVGTASNAILQQRFYQLMINYDPNKYKDEKTKYAEKLKDTVTQLSKLKILSSILSKYQNKMDREFFQLIKKFQ